MGPAIWVERGCWAGTFSSPVVTAIRPLKKVLSFAAAPVSEPVSKKPRGQRWKEPPGEEPVRKKRGRPMTKTLDLDPDPDPGEGEEGVGSRRKARTLEGVGGCVAEGTCTSAEAMGSALGSLTSQFHLVPPSRSPLTWLTHRDFCGSRRGPTLHRRQLPRWLRPPALLPHPAQDLRQQGLAQRGESSRRRSSPAGKPLPR